MADIVVRASAFDNTVRAFAVDAKDTLYAAMEYHKLNPLAATALGRALEAVAMMREMSKGGNEAVTLRIKSDGPMGGLVAVGAADGTLKGYVSNNDYSSYGEDGLLGVGPCLTPGLMTIIKDLGLKEPYSGTIPLQSGEIGDDLAHYYTYSEQVPSLVALGVKLNPDATVESAAGMIIQLMPGATNDTINRIEDKLREAGSASKLFEKTGSPKAMLGFMLAGGDIEVTDEKSIEYKCGCSRESMLRGVISLGREELEKIISEQDEVETVCHFCEKRYVFISTEIKSIMNN
jgi:molecular chaperone Hsp33